MGTKEKGAAANDAQRNGTGRPILGANGNGLQEVYDTLSETCRAYGITDDQVVAFVWSTPGLRERMRRKFVFSECNKVRARIRNEKMDAFERRVSAQHAAQVRWEKERIDVFDVLRRIDRV
jgi:hypothetical protein